MQKKSFKNLSVILPLTVLAPNMALAQAQGHPSFADTPLPDMPTPMAKPQPPLAAQEEKDMQGDGSSISGNFLSGHFASMSGDQEKAIRYLEEVLEKTPEDTAIAGQLLLLKVMVGHLDEAVALAEKLQNQEGREMLVDLLLVTEQARAGHFKEASERLGRLQENAGETLWLPLMQAWLDAGQGLAPHAVEAVDFVQDTEKVPAFLYYHLALINDFAGFKDAAQRQYELAVTDPAKSSLRAVDGLLNFYARQGMLDKREALFTTFMEARPESVPLLNEEEKPEARDKLVKSVQQGIAEIYFTMASVLYSSEQSYDTILYLQMAVHLRPDFPTAWLMLGNALEVAGNYARASQAYGNVPEESPLFQRALLRKAFILDKRGDPQQALKMLDSLAQRSVGAYDAYIAKGDLLRSKSQFRDAAAAYSAAIERIISEDNSQWALYFARGACLERMGEPKKAEEDFLKALSLYPDQPEVLNYLGYMWLVRGERMQEAADMIAKAYEQRSDQPYIIDSMGWMFYKTGRLPQAVELLERALALMPGEPSTNDHLGDAYWHSGRKTEARFQWQRALAAITDPKQQEAIRAKIKNGLPPYSFTALTPNTGDVAAHPAADKAVP